MHRPHQTDIEDMSPVTFTLALEKLREGNIAAMAEAAGAKYNPENNVVEVVYLGVPCYVNCNDATVVSHEGERPIRSIDRAVILHYLLTATGRRPTGKLVSFKELFPSVMMVKEAEDSMTQEMKLAFGGNPAAIYKALEKIPGERASYGDASIRVDVLPRLSFTYVVWEGEGGQIPPAVTFLYDSTAPDYLPGEDLVLLAGAIALDIIEACK